MALRVCALERESTRGEGGVLGPGQDGNWVIMTSSLIRPCKQWTHTPSFCPHSVYPGSPATCSQKPPVTTLSWHSIRTALGAMSMVSWVRTSSGLARQGLDCLLHVHGKAPCEWTMLHTAEDVWLITTASRGTLWADGRSAVPGEDLSFTRAMAGFQFADAQIYNLALYRLGSAL